MYESHNLAAAIKERAKKQNVAIKNMLIECNLGSNTMSALYHGKSIAFDSLAKIADYLECSVDYLLGRADTPDVYKKEAELLNFYRNLNVAGQEQVYRYTESLTKIDEYKKCPVSEEQEVG